MSAVMLITGTSRGIGRFLANHYLERDMFVIGCSRGPSDIAHERYRHFEVDVTDEKAMSRNRSPFRSVESLAQYIADLVESR